MRELSDDANVVMGTLMAHFDPMPGRNFTPDNSRKTILKKWESLTDEDHSFADFTGHYMKLIKEMELIGQPPTESLRTLTCPTLLLS